GDGLMALFGAPVAHEDHARRAVLAALGVQWSLRGGGNASLPDALARERLTVRMGLNTGLVVVGSIGDNLRMDYTAVGDTTNLAARLQQIAEPDTILISETTQRLVQGTLRLEALPAVQVKGKTASVVPYKVLGIGTRRAQLAGRGERVLSPFVGRDRELASLAELLRQVDNGRGHVVGIVGEAGVGKSRLLYEFQRRLTNKPVTYLEGRCLSYGHTMPYHPIIDMLRHNCGITETDDTGLVSAKVRLSLQALHMEPEEHAPYLFQLLGVQEDVARLSTLSPEAIKARTFATLRQMSLQGSRQRTIVFAVEDLHWIDKTSEAFLVSLVESLAGTATLLLCTHRPGYRPPWLEKSYATQLAMLPLPLQDSRAVVLSTCQRGEVSEALTQRILSRAEGNPFFLEELTRTVLEGVDMLVEAVVPETIQGVLMARIDRLPETSKQLLQTAAVLGREFSTSLLKHIWSGPEALESQLLELTRLEFLYERSGTEESLYVFKHALTQEVAYESLLTTQRQALHAAAGQALEVLYTGHLDDVYDRLAHHYAQTAETDKAIAYLGHFAEKAARSYAHTEAVTALQAALEHIEQVSVDRRDRQTIELVLRLVHSLYFLGRFSEIRERLLQQQERLERLQDPRLAGLHAFWLSHALSYTGEYAQSTEWAYRAITFAQQCGDETTMGQAYYVLARNGFWLCQFPEGIAHGRQAIALLEHTGEQWWLGMAHWAIGINYLLMGELTLAWEPVAQTQAIGDALGDPRLQCYAAWSKGYTATFMGDWETGITACQESMARSPDAVNTAVAMGFLGEAYLAQGDLAAALPCLEHAVQQMRQFRFRSLQSWFMSTLGEVQRRQGQLTLARELATEALALAQEVAFPLGVGLAQHALARVTQAEHAYDAARTALETAQHTYAAMRNRYWVGRTHLDLAGLAHTQGDVRTAATHLQAAADLFSALQLPKYVAYTVDLAHTLGISGLRGV
ncbi:MAG: tetratricopeptide repeat protein, partial [Candidatus Tectomicrobia bacterium]|nr:tetratricopeptide repeat protein [Candidatus Tectomicrobia bacterium]